MSLLPLRWWLPVAALLLMLMLIRHGALALRVRVLRILLRCGGLFVCSCGTGGWPCAVEGGVCAWKGAGEVLRIVDAVPP